MPIHLIAGPFRREPNLFGAAQRMFRLACEASPTRKFGALPQTVADQRYSAWIRAAIGSSLVLVLGTLGTGQVWPVSDEPATWLVGPASTLVSSFVQAVRRPPFATAATQTAIIIANRPNFISGFLYDVLYANQV